MIARGLKDVDFPEEAFSFGNRDANGGMNRIVGSELSSRVTLSQRSWATTTKLLIRANFQRLRDSPAARTRKRARGRETINRIRRDWEIRRSISRLAAATRIDVCVLELSLGCTNGRRIKHPRSGG
jgi:hypothetical protein